MKKLPISSLIQYCLCQIFKLCSSSMPQRNMINHLIEFCKAINITICFGAKRTIFFDDQNKRLSIDFSFFVKNVFFVFASKRNEFVPWRLILITAPNVFSYSHEINFIYSCIILHIAAIMLHKTKHPIVFHTKGLFTISNKILLKVLPIHETVWEDSTWFV